jgi:hypothetical protein
MNITLKELEVINNDRLYIWHTAKNETTGEVKATKSCEYRGIDDILAASKQTDDQIQNTPRIHGVRFGSEVTREIEVLDYSDDEDVRDKQIAERGWSDQIDAAIRYVAFGDN